MNDPAGTNPAHTDRRLTARVWTWSHRLVLRWLLLDEFSIRMDEPERAVAVCADIEGLFVDPLPPPQREHYTLLGCAPAGRLADALDKAGPNQPWLGNLVLDAVHEPGSRPAHCQPERAGCSCTEELLDVVVLGSRRSWAGRRLVDIDLEGLVRLEPRYTSRPPDQCPDAASFRLTDCDEQVLGTCLDVNGLFRERPDPPVHPVTLVGCQPQPPLRAALTSLDAGASEHRRHIAASVLAVDANGLAVTTRTGGLFGSVTGARESALGAGLLDVTFDSGIADPLPTGARQIWDRWYAGPPAERNLWAGYDRTLRHEWAGAALAHHRQRRDRPAGDTYHLDGRFLTDIEGFYCALGEAVNGPGGYFGWNLNALDDCLVGGWGAATPFRLVWHDSVVARQHLVPGYDRRSWAPAVDLEYLLGMLLEHRVDVDLR